MREYTIKVKDDKSELFEQLISSLDFAEVDNDSTNMSDELKQALDHALDQCDKGMTIPHEEVMKQTREKYPHLFK